ncbi:MAG: sigma-70 family RNA polymerase sigma factor [Candidatus Sericytochromatia bacterium]|nr:sigma-70 family RNA polymerase sigma factor [Candidatus Sericytochromatia bacterium]
MRKEQTVTTGLSAEARAASFHAHAHLVPPIARHLAARQPDAVDDLLQVGSIGLLRAIERYDPGQGRAFEPYANACIAGEIRHYLRDQAPLVRPPRELVEMRTRVAQAQHALAQEGITTPSAEAIAQAAGLPADKVADVLQLEAQGLPTSLDEDLEHEGGSTTRYQLIDSRYASFQLATDDRLMVEAALGRLRTVSREVIEFAFYEDLSQTEIAKHLGISQMQVSRRLRKAMDELWKVLNTRIC